jgi:hypothetical protein
MATQIPSADAVRERLKALKHGDMQQLATDSGVPLSTLSNIRNSSKQGPTVDTLRRFWPHLLKLSKKTPA